MQETWSGITKWWEETKTSANNKVEEIKIQFQGNLKKRKSCR